MGVDQNSSLFFHWVQAAPTMCKWQTLLPLRSLSYMLLCFSSAVFFRTRKAYSRRLKQSKTLCVDMYPTVSLVAEGRTRPQCTAPCAGGSEAAYAR